MKFKAALFYHNALVYYSIYHLGEGFFKAKLDTASLPACNPPLLLELRQQGSRWQSDCSDNEVVRELGAAINQRLLRH